MRAKDRENVVERELSESVAISSDAELYGAPSLKYKC
jgi:hypothetical protein